MHKKALLALLLAMAMMLSGCALIEKDMEVDRATEIIRVGDTVYTKGEILDEVDYQLNYMAYYYSMFGMSYDPTDPAVVAETKQSVIDSLVESAVCNAKIRELGLDQLTAEEQTQLEAAVEESWQYNLESIQASYFADTELTGEELQAALEAEAENLGLTREYMTEYEKSYITSEKLNDYVVADVTVTDEELQAAYDEEVAADQEQFTSYPYSYGNMSDAGTTVYYRPAGYRLVKQILVQFTEEDQALLNSIESAIADQETQITSCTTALTNLGVTDVEAMAAKVTVTLEESTATATDLATVTDLVTAFDADTAEEVAEQAQLLAEAKAKLAFYKEQLAAAEAAAFANIDAEADEILAQLASGADWDALMAEKTDDPGMQEGAATAERGYAVCADTNDMDPAFVTASMALENVGDVSDKTAGMYGYYIIQYTADVAEGPVALEEVKDALTATVLAEKQETVYTETVAKWIEEADAKIDYKALED